MAVATVDQQIFAAPIQRLHRLALEPRRETARKRGAQIRPAQFDAFEPRTFHDRPQHAPDRFHLRQLRQAAVDLS